MFGLERKSPGGRQERSRYAVQGNQRLPKHLLLGLDAVADTTLLGELEALAARLWAEKLAFDHRQMRRKESQEMRRLEVAR